jgi:hypothetical protein
MMADQIRQQLRISIMPPAFWCETANISARWRQINPPACDKEAEVARTRDRSHAAAEADEADLIRDVCSDINKAQGKLQKILGRIESLQEYAVAELQLLTAADTKLSAAIVAALLSQAQR